MKKTLFLALLLATASLQAQTIAQWTFETSVPALNDSATIDGIAAEVGTGTASGVHASALTDWSNPVGNGSGESLSANNWTVGDYFQFRTSTAGFSNIAVSYDQVSSGTGPGEFTFAYSADGINFTQVGGSYIVLANTSPDNWSSTTPVATTSYDFDLSGVSALNNATDVYFRIINFSTVSAAGGTVATGGTDRIDNFTVAAVPEPSTYALLALGGFGVLLRRRFARK